LSIVGFTVCKDVIKQECFAMPVRDKSWPANIDHF